MLMQKDLARFWRPIIDSIAPNNALLREQIEFVVPDFFHARSHFVYRAWKTARVVRSEDFTTYDQYEAEQSKVNPNKRKQLAIFAVYDAANALSLERDSGNSQLSLALELTDSALRAKNAPSPAALREWDAHLNKVSFDDPVCRFHVETLMPDFWHGRVFEEYLKSKVENCVSGTEFPTFEQFKLDSQKSGAAFVRQAAISSVFDAISAVKAENYTLRLAEAATKSADLEAVEVSGGGLAHIHWFVQIFGKWGGAVIGAVFLALAALLTFSSDKVFERFLAVLDKIF